MGQAIAFFICRSRLRVEMSVEELDDLYLTSSKANEENDVTGFLALQDGFFYHYFEGPVPACDALFSTVLNDPRHDQFRTLGAGIAYQRRFGEWNMSFMRSIGAHSPQLGACRSGIGRYLKYANAEAVLVHLQEIADRPFPMNDPKRDHAIRIGALRTHEHVMAAE